MITLKQSSDPETIDFSANKREAVEILYSQDESELVSIAANDLATDVANVCGQSTTVTNELPQSSDLIITIGTLQNSVWIQELERAKKVSFEHIKNSWECWQTFVVENPFPGVGKALVIAGSDRRGTAYGVYELSRKMGVSPWAWWADARIKKRDTIHLNIQNGVHHSKPPRVPYRAFYINDEIFGLLPWAKKTVDPSYDGLGHKVYERVFQLMLRLRANYLWPALKKGSKPFSDDPMNREIADRYGIVVGGSHAEPLTMCTHEWDWSGESRGDWNYKK